jgi:hypothetical protein
MDISNNIFNIETENLNEECILSSYFSNYKQSKSFQEYEMNIKLLVRNKDDLNFILDFIEKYSNRIK